MNTTRLALAVLGVSALLGCKDEPSAPQDACIEPLPECDNPTVPPTFEQIYTHAFEGCGAASTGPSCHSAEGAQHGLVMSNIDTAYDHLLGIGDSDGRARVLPDDPWCSPLLARIESTDAGFVMPRGSDRLSDGYRCAIRQWILSGADRD